MALLGLGWMVCVLDIYSRRAACARAYVYYLSTTHLPTMPLPPLPYHLPPFMPSADRLPTLPPCLPTLYLPISLSGFLWQFGTKHFGMAFWHAFACLHTHMPGCAGRLTLDRWGTLLPCLCLACLPFPVGPVLPETHLSIIVPAIPCLYYYITYSHCVLPSCHHAYHSPHPFAKRTHGTLFALKTLFCILPFPFKKKRKRTFNFNFLFGIA